MKQWIQKYTGILRNLRISYWLYNLMHFKKLQHNKQFYKNYGIHKPTWQSISHADIGNYSNDIPWMDKQDITAGMIKQQTGFNSFNEVIQQQLLQWPFNGYMIIPGLMKDLADAVNRELDLLLSAKKVAFNFTGRKIMDAWQHSSLLNEVFRNTTVISLLEFVFNKPVIPFQTINFMKGSEQKPHSDSIHMTTEPLGYLAAIWIALEDIEEGSGELIFYPGSHRLNYIMGEDYATGNTPLILGNDNYSNYEHRVQEIIKVNKLEAKRFLAKKGDVLIWHANLLHGGSAITSPDSTRKSMVAHYFAKEVLCYHEISQRPAIIR